MSSCVAIWRDGDLRRVRPALHSVQPTPRVPCLSIEGHLRVREDEAEEVETLRRLLGEHGQVPGELQLARWSHTASPGVRDGASPSSSASTNQAYVFEHILVVEEELGRHLEPFENVHHRNGVRDDNRLENLELWTRPQPSGVRARDALEWAREILRSVRRPSRQSLKMPVRQRAWWRWRDSNSRLRATDWDFFGRSRCTDLTRRCPSAEDLGASPDALSPAGLRTEPAG